MPEKMKIAAIICELNPLHQGHQALFSHAKNRCEGLVCVLSGELCPAGGASHPRQVGQDQAGPGKRRGPGIGAAPALGHGRGRSALPPGAWPWQMAWGTWTPSSSGSEEGDAPRLRELAEALLSPGFSRALGEEDTALPFAVRRQRAAARLVGGGCRRPPREAQLHFGGGVPKSPAGPGEQHQGRGLPPAGGRPRRARGSRGPSSPPARPGGCWPAGSGTDGRLPAVTEEVWRQEAALGRAPALLSRLEMAVLCKLRTMGPQDFAALPDVSEGLEYRLYQAAPPGREPGGAVHARQVEAVPPGPGPAAGAGGVPGCKGGGLAKAAPLPAGAGDDRGGPARFCGRPPPPCPWRPGPGISRSWVARPWSCSNWRPGPATCTGCAARSPSPAAGTTGKKIVKTMG